MRVTDFKKRVKRTSETSFEDHFAKKAKQGGLPSWHMSCRDAGWPDRYVHGGRWVELKVLDCLGTQHQLEPEQIARLNDLSSKGEPCFYCAKWENTVILIPWKEFKAKGCKPINCVRYHYDDLDQAVRWVILHEEEND